MIETRANFVVFVSTKSIKHKTSKRIKHDVINDRNKHKT